MIDLANVHGKQIAMVVCGEKDDGNDDVVVFTGTADWDGSTLVMKRQLDTSSFQIPSEWLNRIKPVAEDVKTILLGAEYYFLVSVGNLPDGEDLSGYVKTGLKWPRDE
jgi:hypothetical protein